MNATDKERFLRAFRPLCRIFGRRADHDDAAAWWWALDDLEVDDVVQAIRQLARTAKRMPAPADVRELVEGSPRDHALAAWNQVLKWLREPVGKKERWPAGFGRRTVDAVESAGGIQRLLEGDRFRTERFRADFERAFLASTAPMTPVPPKPSPPQNVVIKESQDTRHLKQRPSSPRPAPPKGSGGGR